MTSSKLSVRIVSNIASLKNLGALRMVYLRKTVDAWDIRQYLDGSWETVSCEPTRAEAKQAVREYRENQPEYRVKSVKIREPKEPYLGYDLITALPEFSSEANISDKDYGDWVVLAKTDFEGDREEYKAVDALRKSHKFYKAETKKIVVQGQVADGSYVELDPFSPKSMSYILLNPYSTVKTLNAVENYLGAKVAKSFVYEPKNADDGVNYLMSSARGQYLPRGFKEFIISDAWSNRADFMLLRDDKDENYWDVWNDILDNFEAVDSDGNIWYLHQDGDLFAVCPALMSDKRYKEFFGTPRD